MGTKLLALAQIKDTTAIIDEARRQRRDSGDPLDLALPALTLLAGTAHETSGYSFLAESEKKAAHTALKTARRHTARKMLATFPELERKVLQNVLKPRKVNAGPLGRMPREERAVRLLSKFLLDVSEAERLKRRGFFAWDDGRAQVSLVLDYAWRQTTDRKTWRVQKPKNLLFASRFFARAVFREFRDNAWVRALQARYFMAWHMPDTAAVGRAKSAYEKMISQAPGTDDAQERVLFATSSLLDLGLRRRSANDILSALDATQDLITPMFNWRREHPYFALHKAWAHAFAGDTQTATDLLAKVTRSRNTEIRAKAVPLYAFMGEHARSATLQTQIESK